MSQTHGRFNKLAGEAYDRIAASGRFDIAEVEAEILRELSAETTNRELLAEVAALLAGRADKSRTARSDSQQLDLLTGDPAALDSVLALGGGERVTARVAKRGDLLRWLGIREKNFDRVRVAIEADRHTVAELLVYMPDDEIAVEAAVQARKDAQP